MLKAKRILKILKKYGAKPATQRPLSLLTLSAVGIGYTNLLKKEFDLNFGIVAALGNKDGWYSILNEKTFAKATEFFLSTHKNTIEEALFVPAENIIKHTQQEIIAAISRKEKPKLFLQQLAALFPQFMMGFAVFNGCYRYVGNREVAPLLSSVHLKRIARNRNNAAQFYKTVDTWLKNNPRRPALPGIPGNLIPYMTFSEIDAMLRKKEKISISQKNILQQRLKGYFYLNQNGKEIVVTEKSVVAQINHTLFTDTKMVNTLQGIPAYPGKVQGIVHIFQKNKKQFPQKPCIIVTSMTHPDDMSLLKQCSALITDEGGILSHAATLARELKKPCVIGTKFATKVFKDGDLVEVDAEHGIVRKIG